MVNQFEGTFKRVYKRDNETGAACFGIETDEIDVRRNQYGAVECEGIIPEWPGDLRVIISGSWNEAGTKLLVETIKPYVATEELRTRLLKNVMRDLKEEDGDFKVGQSIVKKIIEVSGPDVLKFVSRPDSMQELKKRIKADEWKLKKIHEALSCINDSQQVFDIVSHFGCNVGLCDKLVKKYGTTVLRRLKAHPYKIGHSIGMDFQAMDKMGRHQRVDALSRERVASVIYEALDALLTKYGSTYIIQSMLKKQIERVVKNSSYSNDPIPFAYIGTMLNNMSGIKTEIVTSGVRIYRKNFYNWESSIARDLKRLSRSENLISEESLNEMIKKRESEFQIKYSDEQKQSFKAIQTSGVKIITGGPGVGKTTTINGLIASYRELLPEKKIALAAPTGRAAKRMWDVTGTEASTIHKLLDFQPFSGGMDDSGATRNKENPIDADFLVIDEMSMVDTELFYLFL